MTKDGVREKITRDLKRLYDGVVDEPPPPEFKRLIKQLN